MASERSNTKDYARSSIKQGLRGLIIGEFDILTTGNALKCILSQSKGGDRKIFCSLRSQGVSINSFASRPRKALGGPGSKTLPVHIAPLANKYAMKMTGVHIALAK